MAKDLFERNRRQVSEFVNEEFSDEDQQVRSENPEPAQKYLILNMDTMKTLQVHRRCFGTEVPDINGNKRITMVGGETIKATLLACGETGSITETVHNDFLQQKRAREEPNAEAEQIEAVLKISSPTKKKKSQKKTARGRKKAKKTVVPKAAELAIINIPDLEENLTAFSQLPAEKVDDGRFEIPLNIVENNGTSDDLNYEPVVAEPQVTADPAILDETTEKVSTPNEIKELFQADEPGRVWYPAGPKRKDFSMPLRILQLFIILITRKSQLAGILPASSPLLHTRYNFPADQPNTPHRNVQNAEEAASAAFKDRKTHPVLAALRFLIRSYFGEDFVKTHSFTGLATNGSVKIGLTHREQGVVFDLQTYVGCFIKYAQIDYTVNTINLSKLFSDLSSMLVRNETRTRNARIARENRAGLNPGAVRTSPRLQRQRENERAASQSAPACRKNLGNALK